MEQKITSLGLNKKSKKVRERSDGAAKSRGGKYILLYLIDL